MMHHPFRVLSKRAFMARSTRPLLRARFPLVSGRKERERERKRARVRTTLVLLFGFEFCLSLKIPPTKKGERFSRLLNSNGSNSYVYAVVLTTSVAFSLFFLLLLIIIILILKSSRWCPSMILRCVCVFVFSDDDTNRERTS